jgi:membrane protease YdiL (CAAX protease family)
MSTRGSFSGGDAGLFAWAPGGDLGIAGIDGPLGPLIKALLPVVAYLAVAPALWLVFRKTWRELDAEATDHRQAMRLAGRVDTRPWVLFAIVAVVLTLQEYYGGSRFFASYIRPWLREVENAQKSNPGGLGYYVDVRYWGELYSYTWWAFTRIVGYTLLPLAAWKIIYRRDSVLDMGLRTKGLWGHAWIYAACLVVVIPCVFAVSRSPEFSSYYPFYKLVSRSWLDLILWEALYIAQFFALEVFFRGFMLVPLRKNLGTGAIFAMCVPYVMIHYGKPYLESSVAFIAGVALGSLAMRTRSIYSGFLVHCTVALLMDGLAIASVHGVPTTFWPR